MKTTMTILSLLVLFTSGQAAAQTTFAEGLQFPQRLIFTPQGSLLVSEGGTSTPNTGRVSLLNREGVRRSLLEGLPAAPGHGIPAFGPGGMGLAGRTLYIAIGEGNVMVGPPFTINLAGPSSPIFHSILRIEFSVDIDTITSSFLVDNHWGLLDGYDLHLTNANGVRALVRLLTTFRPLLRNILGSTAPMRPSDPYGAFLDAGNNAFYVIDSSHETLNRVDTVTGRNLVLTRFQPDQRGTAYFDSVPTAVCPVGDSFLVSFLSGAPFPAGASSVRLWTPSDGGWSKLNPLISDLNMTNDMFCLLGGTANAPRVVTVEYSTTADRSLPSGRVQFIDGAQKRVVMQNILLPTGVTQDPVTGDLFVSTLGGAILRTPLP